MGSWKQISDEGKKLEWKTGEFMNLVSEQLFDWSKRQEGANFKEDQPVLSSKASNKGKRVEML